MNSASVDTGAQLDRLRAVVGDIRASLRDTVIGQHETTDLMLIALLAGGHVLLEGPPGVGKTLMVRALATATGLDFARVQFTPDLMPADITGTSVLAPDDEGRTHLEFRKGPVFSQLLLADEINRATPRTQSALLEAMQEGTVSAAGTTRRLPRPFFVLATQNPIEMDGTYVLPEAQIDRFLFRIDVGYPDEAVLTRILETTTGEAQPQPEPVARDRDVIDMQHLVRRMPIAPSLQQAIAKFCIATQPHGPHSDDKVNRYVRFGVSPRGAQALVVSAKARAFANGRNHVSIDDLRHVLLPVTRHRVQANFEGRAAGIDIESLIMNLFDRTMEHA